MTEQIEQWMRDNGVKRIANLYVASSTGWAVYLDNDDSTFGTGDSLADALADARGRA